MKLKAFLTAISLSILCISTIAQKPKQSSEIDEKVSFVVNKLHESFNLEKLKRSNVEAIFTQFYKGQERIRGNIQGPASGMASGFAPQDFQSVRKQNELLIADRDDKLKKELTDDQFKKWKSDIEPALRTPSKKRR